MVLTGCGLSLEGVAGVDQEGPPGEEGAAAGFEDTIEFSNEGTRTSLGVQRSWRPSGYASGLAMKEEPQQHLGIESTSCI